MHNIKDIRNDPSKFKDSLKKRFLDLDLNKLLELDENNRKLIQEKENLENKKKKKVMMVSLDIYRPAAQEQLKSLGEQNNILTLPIIEGQQPADICQRAISAANLNGADIILFDTAEIGRAHV